MKIILWKSIHKQIAQLRVKPVEPHKSNAAFLALRIYFRLLVVNPLSPHDALKHHFTPLKTYLIFFTANDFRRQISIKLLYEYIVIFFNLSPTSNNLHPLQVKNCDSNSRIVMDEDDNG